MRIRNRTFCLIMFSAVTMLAPAALGETMQFKAALKGSAEVPPVDSKGAGTLTATYDTTSKQLKYEVTYSGLTGPAIMAHFHSPADLTQTAPPTIPMGNPASPISGTATLNDAQADALLNGKMYFNVHTDAHRSGEIRGQVVK